ncbi:M12 family metallo-peptidase [Aliikangiella maris]|uniref:M12 family metallo-peptidase n=2 Tax=Aliikangiella maris TaxID=3162458 RepID=A0ABV3MSY4_9GAMM
MKNNLKIKLCALAVGFSSLISSTHLLALEGNALHQKVTSMETNGAEFQSFDLFATVEPGQHAMQMLTATESDKRLDIQGAEFFKVNMQGLNSLKRSAANGISLSIPYGQKNGKKEGIKVKLFQKKIFTDSAQFIRKNGMNDKGQAISPDDMDLGIHYQGIVEGEENSIVAISIFKNGIEGRLHSTQHGDINFGKLRDVDGKIRASNSELADSHVMIRMSNLEHAKPDFQCGNDSAISPFENSEWESGLTSRQQYSFDNMNGFTDAKAASDYEFKVKTILSGYLVYEIKQAGWSLDNWVSSVLNQVSAVYDVNDITMLSNGYIWYDTNNSPTYDKNNGNQLLTDIHTYDGSNTKDSDGSLLLTSSKWSATSGGLAWVRTMCSTNQYRVGWAALTPSHSYFPTYSWTVDVYAHEMGHIAGSEHTHSCKWNGNNTAIDSCGQIEGTCAAPGRPAKGQGTVMSYCHFNVGKNPALGFGSQPGARIRNHIYSCASR